MIRRSAVLLCLLLFASVAMAFVLIDDTHDQTVGGTKTHVFPDIGQVTFATMAANILTSPPADGQLQYCTDCLADTTPCTGGGSGAMATRVNGQWDCGVGACTAGTTPTPLAFGTPGVIPVFAATELGSYAGATCPTPQVVKAISASGSLTCGAAAGSTCPAGNNSEVQYNSSGSCGAEPQFAWFTNPTYRLQISQPTPASTPTPGFASLFVANNQNTATSGAWVLVRNAGTSATADAGYGIDVGAGVTSGNSNRYLMMGRKSDSGGVYQWVTNSSFNPDARTGTGWLALNTDLTPTSLLLHMTGSATVPGLGDYDDSATGFSRTTTGGLHRLFSIIVANSATVKIEHEVTGENSAGVDGRFRLYHAAPAALTGAGPAQVTITNSFMELSTSNGAGTAVVLDTTATHEGEVLVVMNTAANDLTFVTASGANFCQKTAGGATQTLLDDGSSIEFMLHSSCWVQTRAVVNPS